MSRSSIARLLKTFAFLAVLVVAADYASFAATGQNVILGKLNKADRATTIERTTAGPALNLVTKAGSPGLKVNRTTKVANLNADRLDGLDSTQLARRPRVTSVQTTECSVLPSVTTTYQKVADIATFTKQAAGTLVRLDLSNRVFIQSTSGSTGTIFEMRVDDQPTTIGSANTLVQPSDDGTYVEQPLFGVFSGLGAGTHTVSIWVRVSYGTGTNARFDPGCWNSLNVNHLLVTEF